MHYVCTNCGNTSLRWEGKCSVCGEWNTYEEVAETARKGKKGINSRSVGDYSAAETVKIKSAKVESNVFRTPTGISELDRVLGGGFVKGEVVLLSGEPGVGKSTLLLQVSDVMAEKFKVLYVSGEESISQLWGRYDRLGVKQDFDVTSETDADSIIASISTNNYDFVVVDSIQSLVSSESSGFPGSISQVRLCGSKIVEVAKRLGVTIVIVGQITKTGSVAGPKILEHMVDCVLHMEGDSDGIYKLLRAGKNRFGSIKEIGVFNMIGSGLEEIKDPSEIFTTGISDEPGTCIGAVVEGSRVIMLEVQALVVDRGDVEVPRKRISTGLSRQRLEMLCAVLSQKGAVFLGDKDVYVNISGAGNIYGNSLDLAVCVAIRSAVQNKKVMDGSLYVGEISLTGGVKPFFGLEQVFETAGRVGYKTVISPVFGGNFKQKVASTDKGIILKEIEKVSQL